MADDKSPLVTLTDQMRGWADGDPDLVITGPGRDRYMAAINTLRGEIGRLQGEVDKVDDVKHPGNYKMGLDVDAGFEDDAETLKTTLTEYVTYLNTFEQTLTDALARMEATDG